MKKQLIFGITLAAFTAGQAMGQALTDTQEQQLMAASQGFSQQATILEGLMENKLTALAIELAREGRLDTEESAAKASATVNAILNDLGQLYGEFIKTKVNFVLDAKNVLTDEQKLMMLSQIRPQQSLPYETIQYMQPDIFDLPLNLSVEQEKKIIALEADLLKKEVDLERDVELTLLDLRSILLGGQPQPDKVDPLILKLADLAAQNVNNRVAFFVAAKDVLTLDQKRLLGHMLGLN